MIDLKLPKATLFIGSYIKVPILTDNPAEIDFDKLEFKVLPGPEGGIISLSRDNEHDPERPEIMLCIGYKTGNYGLQVLDKGTGNILAEARFRIADRQIDKSVGHSKWFTGINQVYPLGDTPMWGGGEIGKPDPYMPKISHLPWKSLFCL